MKERVQDGSFNITTTANVGKGSDPQMGGKWHEKVTLIADVSRGACPRAKFWVAGDIRPEVTFHTGTSPVANLTMFNRGFVQPKYFDAISYRA